MFPFSPSFLAARSSTGSPAAKEMAASSEEEPQAGLQLGMEEDGIAAMDGVEIVACGARQESTPCKAALVRFPHSASVFVSGFCDITLLRGQASIYGYALMVSKTQRNVYAPPWSPALPLEATIKKALSSKKGDVGKKQTISKALKKANKTDILELISSERLKELEQLPGCVVLVESIRKEEQERMVAAEDTEVFLSDCSDGLQILGGSAMVVTKRVIEDIKLVDALTIPPTWRAAVSNASTLLDSTPSAKLLLCGAKGVGKSSCLRYTINTLLKKCKAICLLDCDVGQPECGLPGTASLHLLSEPLLSPPHFNTRKSLLSHYLGDASTKNDPNLLIEMITSLLARYNEARLAFAAGKGTQWLEDSREEDQADKHSGNTKKVRKLLHSANIFEALEMDNDGRFEVPLSLPLVVNTDGYIRYMGAEILGAVVDTIEPDRVFHLMTDKDKHLPALDRYLEGGESPKYSPQVATLSPGRSSPSKVSAVDLRTLRLVAYFLRRHPILSILYKDIVQIRSAAVVDKHGAVATALCSLSAYGVPLSQVTMQCTGTGSAVRSDKLAAVLNGSLVGVLDAEETKKGNGVEGISEGGGPVRCLGLGIVRHVDESAGRLLLITPIPPNDLPQNVVLSMGPLQLPLSMSYSPHMPVHPYMTAESAGDGSSKMKARNNVKRR